MGFEAIGVDVSKAFWRTVGTRPIGAAVVTANGSAGRTGFLALSFAHVSAEPPTVLVSVGRSTSALPTILESRSFAVNILPAGEEALARAFGGEVDAAERFDRGDWATFVTGAPVLSDAAGVFDCELVRTVEEAGAIIMIGRVLGVRSSGIGRATVAFMGGYRDL